jgi:hypothetical protein
VPCYRTEIVIPVDRYVCLQLPEHLPEGRATVTVQFQGPEPDPVEPPGAVKAGAAVNDPDVEDIEWWEEFEGELDPLG